MGQGLGRRRQKDTEEVLPPPDGTNGVLEGPGGTCRQPWSQSLAEPRTFGRSNDRTGIIPQETVAKEERRLSSLLEQSGS
jgi:hypothetical protein